MAKSDLVKRFMSEVGNTPVHNRREGFGNRKASLWGRALALGFLVGVASSVALWTYERRVARPAAGS
jgi:hypothetical protein